MKTKNQAMMDICKANLPSENIATKKDIELYQTNGDIEWYKLDDHNYEGFNKKNEVYEYTLRRDKCGLWVLRGQGKDATGQFRHDLMESVSLKVKK